MTSELDPLRFKTELGSTLARYITTAAAISSSRTPRLSRAIADACGQADLVRGPFVESLPDFEKGGSIASLILGSTARMSLTRSTEATLRSLIYTRVSSGVV